VRHWCACTAMSVAPRALGEPIDTDAEWNVAQKPAAASHFKTAQQQRWLVVRSATPVEAGFLAGAAVTALLHPWDRAMYLSIIRQVPFLNPTNWQHPWRGLTQTLVGRAVSSGFYFPLEDRFAAASGSHLIGGQAAGIVLGFALNPLSVVKYQCWGSEGYASFRKIAQAFWRDAGPKAFFRGVGPTMARDAVFGCCFSLRKLVDDGQEQSAIGFGAAMFCAAAGTIASSPFNYLRNLCYAEPPTASIDTLRDKRRFWQQSFGSLAADARNAGSVLGAMRVVQNRLRIGWGTARVAFGMALTDCIYKRLLQM